ncbi:Translational repressor [Knufia obscura]|uniref:Translational repressor n=1 Tax=Knufia obscura TaxID=1635080 RepID=A0ABR0S2J5_9EURO|nr:Translational repressor [Knufia obscura]
MAQQNMNGVPGPAGRKLHIAHRRSPSELTPLMMEQLALQSQIEMLQQQQQQIAATHQQYVNMGMIPQGMQGMGNMQGYSPVQGQQTLSPSSANNFQFPQMQQQQQQQMGMQLNAPQQAGAHRRNQSALPNMGMGPPPAPSSGASGFNDMNQQALNQNRENTAGRGRGGPPGAGHNRRHSLGVGEAKKAAEAAEKKRTTAGFQFPMPGAEGISENPEGSPQDNKSSPSSGQGLGLQRAGNIRVPGHGRSQSMAVGGARGGGAAGRGGGSFQFPGPSAGQDAGAQSDLQRRGSQGHGRSQSRNFDGNWRQQNNQQMPDQSQQQQQQPMGQFNAQQQMNTGGFQPGHRTRGSVNQSVGSMGGFQYPGQAQMMQMPQGQMMINPQLFAGQQLNPLQIAQLQAMQGAGLNGLQASQHAVPQMGGQQQQQRKTLFTPYLPQATLPALLNDGQLVAGTLRVNKKNRSDAYVTTNDLDADIFICGSKDRNRALEGDLVAIELLDVDEVWGQKREKEEKKKRKDITDTRSGSTNKGDSGPTDTSSIAPDGSIRRRGSLRQRPTQKKNDDVEVEGQSLLLMEEEEISDEAKPLYAGHVVAVIERVAGQMFSGTLGLLRPSSQATKEKQEAERGTRDGGHGRNESRMQDKPKIVWFKPTDKRVPLIAIPTEQAPRDFVEKHMDYANRIFVACIKRWPITSLHPFGTLVEQLGEMGDLRVETDALLRDNNFGSDEFSDAVMKSVGWENWSIDTEDPASLESRRDFRNERTFTIDPTGTKELDDAFHVKSLGDGRVELGVHVTDVAHFIKGNSLVDREAKKRGTGVYLINRAVSMLPPRLSSDVCSLLPDQDRLTVSVIFNVDLATGKIEEQPWIGRSIIKSNGKLAYEEVDSVISGTKDVELQGASAEDIETLAQLAKRFREARFGNRSTDIPPLRLLCQLDDENVPVEQNIFNNTPSHEIIEEISYKANFFVAQKLQAAMPDKAMLRRQAPPNPRRLQTFAERMTNAGYEVDTSSSGSLQDSVFKIKDADFRKGMETLLVKTFQRSKYYIAEQVPEEHRQHFVLNMPVYTHFTNPSRRYADIVVHRQLESILSEGAIEFTEDLESLAKTAEQANNKKDSAQNAQEQSVHIEACRMMDKKSKDLGGDLISDGIVICVYESAFDVLIPEYGFEKRVHCDQLPLKKAEFRKEKRVLELYWEKGVPSSAFVPEDERPRGGMSTRGASNAQGAEGAKQRAKERYEAQRKQMDTSTMKSDDVDALFDDDDSASEVAENMAGVSLNDRSASMPTSPKRNGLNDANRTQSDSVINSNAPESKLNDKEKYLSQFKLREEGGEYIQDITEMTRIPVILKTDLTKSPPCLTIRSVNPYAL